MDNVKTKKWTLITGGAQNLGAALSQHLAKQGRAVAIHYRESKNKAEEIARRICDAGGTAITLFGDFSTEKTTDAFIKAYLEACPQTEIFIYNVGNHLSKPASLTTSRDMRNLFETNLYAPFSILQAVLPSLKENEGHILFIGVAGLHSINAETYSTAYHMTKLCLCQLTKSLAKELAPFHIRVNMISPGYLENSMTEEEAKKKLPLKRTGTFEEAARVACFICSADASYITGQNIEIAGGVRL